jgi:hypothetical protein
MGHRLPQLLAGIESNAQALDDRLLADHFAQPAGPQRRVALALIIRAFAVDNGFA